jgi:nicotinic acid mononucleotide adenylyltransferase
MRIDEVIPPVKPINSKTPEQQRVANLKQGVDRAKSLLDAERERQQRSRATQSLRRAQARMRAATGS